MEILNTIPETSRVWIYSSKRPLTKHESSEIKKRVAVFTKEWNAHGAQMEADFTILDDTFLILGANEDVTQASGCSIDKAVRIFQDINKDFDLGLFDRTKIYFESEDNLFYFNFFETEKLLEHKSITAETIVYDSTVDSVAKLKHNFKTELKNTWLNRYVKS